MPRNNRPLIFTAFNCAAFFALGMVAFQRGPSFNDLILISNTDVEGGSYYFMACNFGFMLGSILAGVLYCRIQRKTLTIAVALMFTGLFTIFTPWCRLFATMFLAHGIASFCLAVYETTIRTEEMEAWDGSSESAVQVLSFCESVAGIVGPLITEPFMAPKEFENGPQTDSSVNASLASYLLPDVNVISVNEHLKSSVDEDTICSNMTSNCINSTGVKDGNVLNPLMSVSTNVTFTPHEKIQSNIHYAYLITGGLSVMVSLIFYAASTKSYQSKKRICAGDKVIPAVRTLPKRVYIATVTLVCLFYYFFTMGLGSHEQYLFYFVVTHLNWSKRHGAYLVSMHKATMLCSRLAVFVIIKCLTIGVVLVISLLGVVASISLFTLAGHFQFTALVWLSTGLLAAFISSVFGGVMAWTDGNLIKLSGKETSAVMISASLGTTSIPLPMAMLMKHFTLMAFPYSLLAQSCTSTVLFLVMMFVVKSAINRRFGPLRFNPDIRVSQAVNDDDEDVTVQGEQMNGKAENNNTTVLWREMSKLTSAR